MTGRRLSPLLLAIFLAWHPASAGIERYGYEVVNAYPHDREAFTQGLFYRDGYLYESTGLRGHSSLRKVEIETGRVEKIRRLPDRFFGEGATYLDGRIYQLTWQSRIGFVYDTDFNIVGRFRYGTEGWGLTNDGNRLIMSDGSNKLYFMDPESFELLNTVEVTFNGMPVRNLNELQYIDGTIYANVWKRPYIVIIHPGSGEVTGVINLQGIIDPRDYDHRLDVLNGIAYDEENGRLFVTGKFWPLMFEIKLTNPPEDE